MNLKKAGYVLLAASLGVLGSYGVYQQHESNSRQKEQIQELEEKVQLIKSSQISSIKNVKEALEILNNSDASLEEKIDLLTSFLEATDSLQSSKIDFLTGRFEVVKKNVEINNEEIAELRQKEGQLDVALYGLRLINKETFFDLNKLYNETINPTIRITDGMQAGSGVVLYSKKGPENKYYTFILTAHHVVEEVEGNEQMRIHDFANNGEIRGVYLPEVIAKTQPTDLAVIKVVSPLEFKTAKLMPKHKIKNLRLYDPVCTVGCPLGFSPLPSTGVLSSTNTRVNGEIYWMITSPAAPGNSGGGIFLSESNELIGIMSRVVGVLNPSPALIPHLGMMSSPENIYQFLDENNLQFIYDETFKLEDYLNRKQN